ncbi:hypothetical protein D3C87_1517780 [compost metagenome]
MARERKDIQLELAVLDKLGEVYILLKDYKQAENTYEDFAKLKASFHQAIEEYAH